MTVIEKPTNWGEAAAIELDLIGRNLGAFSHDDPVGKLLNMSRDLAANMNTGKYGVEQLLGHRLVAMGTLAAAHLDTLGLWSKKDMLQLLCSKQHDYGHGNILSFGVIGVAVRMSDKVARLVNLTSRDIDAVNESLLDTWRDIVGYAVIAGMLLVGTFTLEL
jgi:hypothetical protein